MKDQKDELRDSFTKLMKGIISQGTPTEEEKETNRKHYKIIMKQFRQIIDEDDDEEFKKEVLGMMATFTTLLSLNGSINKDTIKDDQ